MSICEITKATRRKSYFEILASCAPRQKLILDTLRLHGAATANEITQCLVMEGKLSEFSRNFVQPRLNELIEMGLVEVVEKRRDGRYGKTCAVYAIKD